MNYILNKFHSGSPDKMLEKEQTQDNVAKILTHHLCAEEWRMLEITSGSQADIYIVRDLHREINIVVKIFKKNDFSARKDAQNEYEYLRLLKNIKTVAFVSCPEPHSVIPETLGNGYAMEYIDGQRVSSGSNLESEEIGRIIDFLGAFHDSCEIPYGDFQPDNLIVGKDNNIYFIDPGAPTENHRSIENRALDELPASMRKSDQLLVIDLGYLLFSESARSIKRCFTSPIRGIEMVVLSGRVLMAGSRAVNCRKSLFFERVADVARMHCLGLIQDRKSWVKRIIGAGSYVICSGIARLSFALSRKK